MAQNFELNPIRKSGASGAPDAIGLQWTEEASWRYSLRTMIWMLALPFAVLIDLAGIVFLFGLGSPFMLIMGIGFTIWIVKYMTGKLPVRSVLLRRDGKIEVPHGMPGMKSAKFLKVRQPDVVGFEIGPAFSGMQQDWTSTVQAVTNTGSTVTVSKALHREEAREIVVGLNLALREMRVSVGTEPMQAMRGIKSRVLVD